MGPDAKMGPDGIPPSQGAVSGEGSATISRNVLESIESNGVVDAVNHGQRHHLKQCLSNTAYQSYGTLYAAPPSQAMSFLPRFRPTLSCRLASPRLFVSSKIGTVDFSADPPLAPCLDLMLAGGVFHQRPSGGVFQRSLTYAGSPASLVPLHPAGAARPGMLLHAAPSPFPRRPDSACCCRFQNRCGNVASADTA